MAHEREYLERVFDEFLREGRLPVELPREIVGLNYGDAKWNEAVHYFSHVVTDKDIRAKDPELDTIMRAKLSELLGGL